MKNSESIEKIRKRFRRQWLLIAVDKTDEQTTTPLTGRLLAHSPHQDEIYRASRKYKVPAYLTCTPDMLPKDVAIIFHVVFPA